MNKFFGLAALALITLGSCGEKKKEEISTTPKVQEVKAGSLKIAFYNQDSLKAQFDYYVEQDEYVKNKQIALQKEVDRMTNDFKGFLERNDKKAKEGQLSQVQIQQIQLQAQQKEQEIMEYQQSRGAALEEETIKLLEELGKKIETYSRQYSEKHKIDILLTHSAGGQFAYITPNMDVTKEFIAYLNQHEAEIKKDMGK
jgi:outer membrane protein